MNVTELARKLKTPSSELFTILPRLGFDIGRKAIKVDDKVAQKIIKRFKEEPQVVIKIKEELKKKDEIEEKPEIEMSAKEIVIPPTITVRDFASYINMPVATVIQELMKNGILANLNEQIDYETASILAQDFGFKTKPQEEEQSAKPEDEEIKQALSANKENLTTRPPVVVVMGHVDHGKTMLLDAIRKTKIMAQESGGITQHIGAYQMEKNGRIITFIDTPGHEAFTAMRSRGARIADIAILVIAADDGIKPQTVEAIKIIDSAKLPFIVALNKIDKPEADVEKIKQQLAQKNLLPEDWGGKIITIPVSAKSGKGIEDLLDHLILLTDLEKDNIKANPGVPAIGTIIESHIDKGEGATATAIIQTGTLRQGEFVQVGNVVGKIRAMKDYLGKEIKQALPSMPVKILGLKDTPEVGDFLQVKGDEISLKKINKKLQSQQKVYRDKQTWQRTQTKHNDEKNKKKTVNIILKTDMLGSQEALLQSLETLSTDEVKVEIVGKGLGNITEADVLQAEGTKAAIYGFKVKTNTRVSEIADEKEIPIHLYEIIYDLIDLVKKEVDKQKTIKKEIIELGRAKIIAIFRTAKKSMILGAQVTKGKIITGTEARVIRDKVNIGQGMIEKLQVAKSEVSEVPAGSECGIQFKGPITLQENDFLEVFKEELKK
ncbi:translation initiation factor IF-2 [Patescibacteria group bacterium]|nr:translation initiation factor IF-2 [Patescibacteria group bacterium]MBU0963828.1 translation initiation factor IF-2 [Patescibacteria group bacterium]